MLGDCARPLFCSALTATIGLVRPGWSLIALEQDIIVPHYISEDHSDMRGIKHGWYAVEDDGNLSSGPFSSREECIKRITQPTNGTE
jgi:hypothetical protein